MISLSSPITISPAPVNGKTIPSFTLTSIDYSVSYDNTNQSAVATIKPLGVKVVLWDANSKPSYDSAGNFTDKDTDARLSSLLNVSGGASAIKAAIEDLFPKAPAAKTVPVKKNKAMNSNSASDLNNASSAGALISLVGVILSFFGHTHIWLQNLTLLVSLFAGLIAISAGVIKFGLWIKKILSK